MPERHTFIYCNIKKKKKDNAYNARKLEFKKFVENADNKVLN